MNKDKEERMEWMNQVHREFPEVLLRVFSWSDVDVFRRCFVLLKLDCTNNTKKIKNKIKLILNLKNRRL